MAMRAPHSNLTAAHSWLHAMGDAAAELNVTIQYCLVEPAMVLASAAIPAVTNIRASGDYHPGALAVRARPRAKTRALTV